MQLFRPYYYGQRKWDNYLLDVREAIVAGNVTHFQAVRFQEAALGIAGDQLGEMHNQADELRNIKAALQDGFEDLRSSFEWGFTLMVDRMDTQTTLLSDIKEELMAIHVTLNAPLLTQFSELFQRGEQRYRMELWDKALNDFLEAEKIDEVNPLLQLKIGQLYVYGVNSSCNVIDLSQAESHLLAAVRYADASERNEISGRAYFHAAVATYLMGERERTAGQLELMRTFLERSLGYLAKAAVHWPKFIETLYTQAKVHALLGQDAEAIKKLEMLSDRDRRYFAKASQDRDFDLLRADVERVFKGSLAFPGPLATATKAKIDKASEALDWARRSDPPSKNDLAMIEFLEKELQEARKILPTLEADIETMAEKMDASKTQLEDIAQHAFEHNQALIERTIQTFRSSCAQQKASCESGIEQLEQTINDTTSPGAFWLFAAVTVIVEIYAMVAIQRIIMPQARHSDGFNILFMLAFFGTPLIAGILGNVIITKNKTRPFKLKIDEYASSVDRCIQETNREINLLTHRAQILSAELRRFQAWK